MGRNRDFTSAVGAVIFLSFCLLTDQALALTGAEITGKMSKEQQFGYLAGLVDMNAFQTAMSGNKDRSKCIYQAFYRNAGNDPWKRLLDALHDHPDKHADSIVYLLLQKICGT